MWWCNLPPTGVPINIFWIFSVYFWSEDFKDWKLSLVLHLHKPLGNIWNTLLLHIRFDWVLDFFIPLFNSGWLNYVYEWSTKSIHRAGSKQKMLAVWNLPESKSRLVAHPRIFRLFIKGKFDAYVLWPFAQRIQN